jgi:hypothetical protein
MELWSALASARDSHFVPSRRRRAGVGPAPRPAIAAAVILGVAPPEGLCLCSGRRRTLAGAGPYPRPPGASQAGEAAQPLPPCGPRSRRCVQSTCTCTAYPPKTCPPSCARVSRNPLGGSRGQYHTGQQPDAASARQESGDGAGGFTLNDGESRGERAPSRLIARILDRRRLGS